MSKVVTSPRPLLRSRRDCLATLTSPLSLGYLEATLNGLASSITAPLVIPFAVTLGASEWQIGVLTALPLLGMNLTQVPAARLSASWGRPSLFLMLTGGLGRIAWLLLALSILGGAAAYPILLVVVTAAAVSSGLQTPTWTAFLGELVPEDRRGSYFGTRNLLAGAASLAGAFGAAYLVSLVGFERGNSVALLVAVVAASGAVISQAVAVARPSGTRHAVRMEKTERDPGEWRTRPVRNYVLYGMLLILGAGMATPFYSVRFINHLEGSPQTAATAMAVGNALVTFGQGFWGRVIDRLGLRLVGAVSLAGIALVPLMWLAATSLAMGVAIWLFNGFMWAACGLATFNLMLAVSNDANRASVVAWVNTLQSPVNFAAPLAGGMLANAAGAPALFALSSLALAASWVYFLWSFRRFGPRLTCC